MPDATALELLSDVLQLACSNADYELAAGIRTLLREHTNRCPECGQEIKENEDA